MSVPPSVSSVCALRFLDKATAEPSENDRALTRKGSISCNRL